MTKVFRMMKLLAIYSHKDPPSNLKLLQHFPILKLLSATASSSNHPAEQNL